MKKIYLDAGHGGTDSGAVGNGLLEKNLVLKLQQYMISFLNTNYTGFTLQTTRTTDTFLSLSERASKANAWGADVFMSIHVNAGGGTGYEDYIYNGSVSSATVNYRNRVHEQVIPVLAAYNHTNRGKKAANFAVLRLTNMPAVLTEIAFIDTTKDANLLKNEAFLQAMANAYARGIAVYLNLPVRQSTVYTIQAGDTFYKIANMYNITVEALRNANPGVNPTTLQIGQEIYVPVRTYIVKAGDTLYKIARMYSVTVQQIQAANPGIDPSALQIGQQIRIPS
ncbi:N-acetylmuramoyl-L-alanine amidase [Priestia flexa]|uniref:N-acetylmuramoyl-L-alanine amidase n=1 Tax=Priestia flexa TaxID=86664 RepID=A0ABU4J0L0_9BACI|nr:N-acetylmuramoyl-L-alanine amidase [Priestia flexa]MDW8514774.1 N-acetylmuramoyl-L-alanine amidase [Priestia flexa]QCS53093.1 LysM peptidoglycan-binding domain-containing protein [Priestia flexa]WHX80866.1 N-acetylmuramoyl-L-alanine amidase [Priestia flexa]